MEWSQAQPVLVFVPPILIGAAGPRSRIETKGYVELEEGRNPWK